MANFNPPFAEGGDKRLPTSTERNLGFPCGPADQALFNQMHYAIEAEVGHVITYAGISQTSERYTQLREAIEALIEAATGSGDTSNFVLMDQARSRLPIFPEILNIDNRIVCTQPVAGSVRMPGGVQFLHRGIFPVTTAQTDFATDPSNTYHLRWDKTMGFRMIPLTDVAYNPTSLNESNALFDTKFDDMLIARVTTSSSNVATISNLKNATRLEKYERKQGPGVIVSTGGNLDGVQYTTSFDLDWARTPMVALEGVAGQTTSNIMHGFGNAITITSQTRYSLAAYVTTDFLNRMENPASFNPWGYIAMTAFRY